MMNSYFNIKEHVEVIKMISFYLSKLLQALKTALISFQLLQGIGQAYPKLTSLCYISTKNVTTHGILLRLAADTFASALKH